MLEDRGSTREHAPGAFLYSSISFLRVANRRDVGGWDLFSLSCSLVEHPLLTRWQERSRTPLCSARTTEVDVPPAYGNVSDAGVGG
jgi:hypothetical protein